MNGHDVVALATLSDEEFDGYVADAIDAIPEPFAYIFQMIPVLTVDEWWHDDALLASFLPGRPAWETWNPTGWQTVAEPGRFVVRRIGPLEVGWRLPNGWVVPWLPVEGRELLGACTGGTPMVIFVCRGSVLRSCENLAELRFRLRCLVEHELGHAVGLTEVEIGRAHHRAPS